jgi:hypothetical protein
MEKMDSGGPTMKRKRKRKTMAMPAVSYLFFESSFSTRSRYPMFFTLQA